VSEGIVCSFCGKGPTEIGCLVKGPGVAICDGCVRVSYEIIERLDADAGMPARPQPDDVMVAITRAQQAALDGDREGAGRAFAELWDRTGPDGVLVRSGIVALRERLSTSDN
jgi:ClpX C4-type zinc finger protein